jgi:formylglycine-generating enzyme required for sulfatase activity
MVLLPAGEFRMGSGRGKEDERPAHTVRLASYWMDRFEVTQAEYEKLGFPNPSRFKGAELPVEMMTWTKAALFANARSRAEGLEPCYDEDTAECNFAASGYRLPTEAEWEYACRAGTDGEYGFGADPRGLPDHAWYAENSSKKTHPAGKKSPNRWGLHDLHGNVAEWCNDVYEKSYYGASPPANPRGPADGKKYVVRGGAWNSSAETCRSPARAGENPGFVDCCLAPDSLGFRLVRRGPDEPAPEAAH